MDPNDEALPLKAQFSINYEVFLYDDNLDEHKNYGSNVYNYNFDVVDYQVCSPKSYY